jgi:hypothetical protein
MRPVNDLVDAVTMPFKALFVVGLCWAINAMTFSGTWWVKWVALGMGIATVVALARGLRTFVVLALAAAAGWWVYKRFGAEGRARFDEWMSRVKPQSADILRAVRPASPEQPLGRGDVTWVPPSGATPH